MKAGDGQDVTEARSGSQPKAGEGASESSLLIERWLKAGLERGKGWGPNGDAGRTLSPLIVKKSSYVNPSERTKPIRSNIKYSTYNCLGIRIRR